MMASRMTSEEYLDAQAQLFTLVQVISGMNLADFLDYIGQAESVGPIVDPTLYMRANGTLEFIRRVAEAAYKFQREVVALRKQYGREG